MLSARLVTLSGASSHGGHPGPIPGTPFRTGVCATDLHTWATEIDKARAASASDALSAGIAGGLPPKKAIDCFLSLQRLGVY